MTQAGFNKALIAGAPHSIEAEQSVLGAVLLDNRSWDTVADQISAGDFYLPAHRFIFEALENLARRQQPFDVITLTDALQQKSLIDKVGGEAFLFELVQNTPSAANVASYAQIVRSKSVLRQLIEAGTDIADGALRPDGDDISMLLDQAEQRVFSIANTQHRGSGPVQLNSLLSLATEKIDTLCQAGGKLTGHSTGYADFDKITSGLHAGDMVVIAGRPSMGKTCFALNIAEHVAIKSEKDPVLFFSLEMPSEQLALRMLSSLGRIDQHRLRTGQLNDDDWSRITSTVSMLSEAKMYIDDTPSLTPTEMRSRARRVARENKGLSLIVVDYLQLMRAPHVKENRTNEVAEISRSLKALAKELSVPVIALSQLNRGLESRTDRRPIMSDLRESGSIEQDADLIVFIYRDEVYNEDTPDKGIAEIIIRKHRNGPIGDFRLAFLGQFTRFENFSSAAVAQPAYEDF